MFSGLLEIDEYVPNDHEILKWDVLVSVYQWVIALLIRRMFGFDLLDQIFIRVRRGSRCRVEALKECRRLMDRALVTGS